MPLHLRQVKIGRLTMGPHVVDLDASRRGYVLVVNERRLVFGERARWTTVTALVLMLHLLVLWGLTVPLKFADMPDVDQDVIQAELYQTPPPPEVQPVMPVDLMPRPVPAPQKQAEVQPQPQPQKPAQSAPASVPAPATPQPQPQPTPQPVQQPTKPAPQVVNRPQDTFDTPRNPTLQARADVKLQSTQAPDQTLAPESKTANVKLKKKQEEELEAKQTLTATTAANLGDIKLHDSNAPVQTVVAPSGLTPDGTHLATGAPSAGGAAGAAGGATGGGKTGLKGGRGALSQALENDDFCLKAQRDGKPIPANCHMKSLTEMAGLTAKLDPHLQKEADAHAFQQKYKTTPGNDAYWKRNSPTSNPGVRLPDDDQAGAYTSDRDQRVMAGTDTDPQNSIHKTAH